jgi:hypothetical protein
LSITDRDSGTGESAELVPVELRWALAAIS